MTREMLEKAWEKAGLYQRTICRNFKGGDGIVTIYNDLGIAIPLGACESGKMVFDKGASIGPYTIRHQNEKWEVLAGEIECQGTTYGVGSKIIFENESVVSVKNTYAGDTIIGFTKYLHSYRN